jgi:hypothetical protein
MPPITAKKTLLPLALFYILLACATEALVRFSGLDAGLLAPLLYYQDADLPVHRLSADGALHYELAPGASAVFAGGRKVTVNTLGFRGPERPAAKAPGVKRVLFLGGSNTYGGAVDDADTYPAILERLLNSRGGGRYEVWNGGVCGYVPSQKIAAAEKFIAAYSPDLVVMQLHNGGRRPFLSGQTFLKFFTADRDLFRENLPYAWPRQLDFLRHLALARALAGGVNRLELRRDPDPLRWNRIREMEREHRQALAAFHGRHSGRVPVAFLVPPGDPPGQGPDGAPEIALSGRLPPGSPPEFLKIHPPPHVYAWYAEVIAQELRKAGLLPPGGAGR